MIPNELVQVGEMVVARSSIRTIDMRRLDELRVTVHIADGGPPVELHNADTVDLLMRLCPKVFEGRRFRFVRHAWTVHNLVGHPLMQVCAWFGKPKLGLWIHDVTVPRPRLRS
jgi:hypothetical protein